MEGNLTQTSEKTIPPAGHIDIRKSIQEMARHPENGKCAVKAIQEALDNIDDDDILTCIGTDNVDKDNKAGKDKDTKETVLHTAVKCLQFKTEEEKNVVMKLINKFPQLILCNREETVYEGQTPLHMAVCKGNTWLVQKMLKRISVWKTTVLQGRAHGSMFAKTVMLGELPLSIAALTFNKGMIDLLLDEGAELDGTNSVGDNVCHSLVRYGHFYPDKKEDVIDICRKLLEDPISSVKRNKQLSEQRKEILLMENKGGLDVLQLSVKLGFYEMFEFIMEQESYCCANTNDGLFDIKVYDVTEMNITSFMEESKNQRDKTQTNLNQQPNLKTQTNPDQQPTVKTKKVDRYILRNMFELEPDVAFQFIQFPPFRLVVSRKWNAYRKYFYPFWLFHCVFICFLTWYSVERSQQLNNSQAGYDFEIAPKYKRQIGESPFVTAFGIITVLVGIALVSQELYRSAKRRMPWTWKSFMNSYGCGFFRIMFFLLGVSLIVDFILAVTLAWYENYCLILSVILGWFLQLFFIRTCNKFSFFTVLIQKVITGDLFRFFVIIGFELIAFATAMYMAIQGSDSADDPNYSSFWRVMFSMFTLIVGLGDTLDFYQTRRPLLCIAIFIGFVVMTSLLMINGLIAIMSTTCTELVTNVGNIKASHRHSQLQRLSVILFFESILMISQIEEVGQPEDVRRYHRTSNVTRRYMLELRSLQSDDADNSDERSATTNFGFRKLINLIKYQPMIEKQQLGTRNTVSPINDSGSRPVRYSLYNVNRCEWCKEHEVICG